MRNIFCCGKNKKIISYDLSNLLKTFNICFHEENFNNIFTLENLDECIIHTMYTVLFRPIGTRKQLSLWEEKTLYPGLLSGK